MRRRRPRVSLEANLFEARRRCAPNGALHRCPAERRLQGLQSSANGNDS